MIAATKLRFAIIALCLCCVIRLAMGACETEDDLDFDSCDLKDLKDDVLKGICLRIGLDMDEHLLPYLYEDDVDKTGDDGAATTRTFTHEDFVRGAEECLIIEEEMDQLEEGDPEYLSKIDREALVDDPEAVAELITDVLQLHESEELLKKIAAKLEKLEKTAPHVTKEAEHMLDDGEKLEARPDVVGHIISKLLSEYGNVDVLEEMGEELAELVEDWHEEEHYEEWQGTWGDGDEL